MSSTGVKDNQIVKGLQTQLSKVEGDIQLLKNNLKALTEELDAKKKLATDLNRKIRDINISTELKVTEHAVLRYIERVVGKSIEEIQQDILCESVINQWKILGNGKFVHPKGFKCVVKDNLVVSITN